jgi:excisionase family DNA binding protein
MGAPKVLEPGQVNTEDAARAMRRIRDYLVQHPGDADVDVTSELAGDGPLILPRAVVVMLASMLAQLAEGRGVTLMASHAELTTVEAASMLNVSRPYLIKLIDSGELPARLVGRHRRVRFGDLIDYKRRTDASAHQAADDLIALSEEMGLYE